ncbi:hypothetical protein HID58_084226 [Brassica napus]|uniref:Cytochrome P450 n=1 Tax=Brassica napus TaxID=3708 RepID=A0ABQ7XJ23_BRANA|nr:hypothetical protein HID58_084226 [Brassica napus]
MVSVGLSWFFWLITKHPEVENKILQEIKKILSQREKSYNNLDESCCHFTVKELNDMVYLQAALLYPPIPMEMKQATEEDVFPDGTFLDKGSRVYFSIYAMGRMKSIWGEECEMKMMAASILLNYSIKVDQDHVVVPRVTTTLYMKHGLKVRIMKRCLEEKKQDSKVKKKKKSAKLVPWNLLLKYLFIYG